MFWVQGAAGKLETHSICHAGFSLGVLCLFLSQSNPGSLETTGGTDQREKRRRAVTVVRAVRGWESGQMVPRKWRDLNEMSYTQKWHRTCRTSPQLLKEESWEGLAPARADFSSSLGRLVKYFVNDKFRKSLSAISKLSCLSGSNFDVLSKPEGTSDRKWFPNEGID